MEQKNFTEGKILAPLVKFALPVLLALFLQTMYGAVDLLVVGRFSTAGDVDAVNMGSWVMVTITALIVGLAMGTTVLLGRKIGEKKGDESGRIIGTSILIFAILAVVLTLAIELCLKPIAEVLNCPAKAFEPFIDYIAICSGGTVFIVAYNVLGSIFRGIGNSKMPLLTVAIACVLNICGDLLLVGVFHMAAAGAAIATVFAQAMSVLISLLIIKKSKLPFTFKKDYIRLNKSYARSIIRLGAPVALSDMLVCISFLFITAIVNEFGVNKAAGVGVAEKICGFVMLVPSAFMQSMSSFVAQNIGAGRYDRAKRALKCGILCSIAVGVLMGYLAFFHGDLLSSVFSADAEIIAASAEYLKSYAIDCLLVSFLFCFIGYFNGCGRTTFVMIQGLVGAFLVRVPASYIFKTIEPVSLFRIGLATPCSTIVQITACVIYFVIRNNAEKKRTVLPESMNV